MTLVRTAGLMLVAALAGAAAQAWYTGHTRAAVDAPQAVEAAPALRYPLQARLYRFELEAGAEPTFDSWMQYLRDHHPAVLETLDREKMYVEGIFRDREHEPRAIYWLAVQGAGGASVESSSHEIDRAHVDFMGRTLRKGSRTTLLPESWLLAPFIEHHIARHQSAAATTP